MNLDRALHVVNALALFVAALYFVISLEASNKLLAEKLAQIDAKVDEHRRSPAHSGAREDISDLTVAVRELVKVTEFQQREITRLGGD